MIISSLSTIALMRMCIENPDVFSILAGCNDYYLWKDDPDHMEEFDETYRNMFDDLREHNPDIKLVMCEPFVAPSLFPDEYKARRTMIAAGLQCSICSAAAAAF